MKLQNLLVLLIGAVLLNSCATIINGKKQEITIRSNPAGAAVRVDGDSVGVTPLVFNMLASQSHHIEIKSQDQHVRTFILKRKYQAGWLFIDIPLSCISYGVPIIVDACTKAAYRMQQKDVNIDFTKQPAPVDLSKQWSSSYELDGTHSMDSLRKVERTDYRRQDSLREIAVKRAQVAKNHKDSAKQARRDRIAALKKQTPNLIGWSPVFLWEGRIDFQYERFINNKFSAGVNAIYKSRVVKLENSKRTYDASPGYGSTPYYFLNAYNAYDKIWNMPYSQGYSLGVFGRYYFLKDLLYVHAEVFNRYAAYDNVTVKWLLNGKAGNENSDSAKTSVKTIGFNLQVGSNVTLILTKRLGFFFDYYVGISPRWNHVDIFHYRQIVDGNVTKYMESESFMKDALVPYTGFRIGLRF